MKTIKEFIEHPMEEIFDLPPGTTMTVREEKTTIAEIPVDPSYDAKDSEIEVKTQQIFDAAMTAFNDQSKTAALCDPKYSARSMEVAAQFLNTALSAIKQRADVKTTKDKANSVSTMLGPGSKTTNVFISQSELLKSMREAQINEKVIEDGK